MRSERTKTLARFLLPIARMNVELKFTPIQFRPYRVASRLGDDTVRTRLLHRLSGHFLRCRAASEDAY
jgi:hypothetical protein